jgi:hypothetical protein
MSSYFKKSNQISPLSSVFSCHHKITKFLNDTVAEQSPHTTHIPALHPTQIHNLALILQFIHQQPEHITRLPHNIPLHQFGPAPASPGNYPVYLCPHLDIQQHLVDAPALTEPGPEAEAGGCFQASIEPHLLARERNDVRKGRRYEDSDIQTHFNV